jgi:hypothetical protein
MTWCYVVMWCVETFGAYPDWSGLGWTFACEEVPDEPDQLRRR